MLETPPGDLRSNRWCGMSAGETMFYPAQVVDGQVQLHAGPELRMHDEEEWRRLLTECYSAVFARARDLASASPGGSEVGVACPLLGAGAKGAPIEDAVAVALEAIAQEPAAETGSPFAGRLCFGFIDDAIADFFAERLRDRFG